MKQQNVIRLTESQLRGMIKESLKDIFNKFGGNKEEETIDKRTQGFVESILSKILFTASGDMSNPTEGDYLYKAMLRYHNDNTKTKSLFKFSQKISNEHGLDTDDVFTIAKMYAEHYFRYNNPS